MVQEGVDWITKHGMYSAKVVDLCAGSGAIGLSFVTEVPGSEVWAVEKSEQTAQWTRRQSQRNRKKVPQRSPGNYHLEIADATQTPTLNQLDGTIDIVLTNPPYVPLADIPAATGSTRLRSRSCAIRRFRRWHAYSGTHYRPCRKTAEKQAVCMVMEHDVTQGERLACIRAVTMRFQSMLMVHNDYTGRPRYHDGEKSKKSDNTRRFTACR